MKRKRFDGQITILAAMIFSTVVSLITATVSSAAFSVGFLKADLVTQAGVTSEFSQYFRPLADNFDIFALEIIEEMDKEMELYMYRSIEKDNSLIPLKLSGVILNNVVRMTDNCGLPIKEEIVKYMKYGIIADSVNMLTGNEEYRKKCEVVNDLNTVLCEASDIVVDMNGNLVMAAHWIDGLAVSGGQFSVKYNAPVYSQDTFIKMAVSSRTPQVLGITDGRVYAAVSGQCQLMTDILTKITVKMQSGQDISAECTLLGNLIRDSSVAGGLARNYCIAYKNKQTELGNVLNEYSGQLHEAKTVVGDEIYEGFRQESMELEAYADGKKKELFDVDKMIAALERNLQSLDIMSGLVNRLQMSSANAGSYANKSEAGEELILELAELMSEYNYSDMVVDYSEVKFIKENGAMSMLKGLYDNIGKGLLGIITQGLKVSDTAVNTSSLALSKYSADKDKIAAASTTVLEKAVFTEYISSRFNSFWEVGSKEGERQEDGGLSYDLEFILFGCSSDTANLSKTLHSIVNMRQGANLMCIISDSEKKQQAYALSATLLGFTGSSGIIKAGQYLIITAWAYAESIMDAKRLVNGEKLNLYKTRQDWKMSLEKVLAFDYSLEEDLGQSQGMLSYRDYVKLLIMMQKESALYYGTMTAMEMRMIAAGYEAFRMENFLYSMSGQAQFTINEQVYDRSFNYSY